MLQKQDRSFDINTAHKGRMCSKLRKRYGEVAIRVIVATC